LSRLYELYYERIFRFCVHRLFDKEIAEDVTSTVFLEVARSIRLFKGRTLQDFQNWLYAIAANQANAYIRKTSRRKELLKEAADLMRASDGGTDESSEPDWPRLYGAILKLKPQHQTIVTLRFFENLKYEQIAQILNVKEATVRVTLHRILNELRNYLQMCSKGKHKMFKDESEFEKIVNRLKIDTEPNPKHREQLRRRVLSAFNEAGKRPASRIIDFKTIRRKIMKNPLTKIAAAAVIIIAVLIGLHFFSDSVSITSTAYAEIVERLHNARTMTYTSNGTTAIEIAFKKPGYMRTTMPGDYVTVIDWTQGKGLSTLPTRKQFIEMEMSNLPHDPAQQQFNVIEKLRTLPDQADEELGTREIRRPGIARIPRNRRGCD